MARSKRGVVIGECYREAGLRAFARPASDWIVRAIYTGRDGIEHARLVGARDHSQEKTLSSDILADRHRFERIDIAG
jgi:hypothetical protein